MRVLLIGPLPPPHGGSRVSFERFLRYVNRQSGLDVTHVDLPIRKRGKDGRPGGVAPFLTLSRGLIAMLRVARAERVVFFSSRGLAFSYGLLLILASRSLGKPIVLRLFGGRPYQRARTRWGPFRQLTEWILGMTSGISLETEVGRADFPDALRDRVKAIPGYRSRIQGQQPVVSPPDDVFRFVYAGRVDKTKGIDVLLDACALLQDRLPAGRDFRVDCYGEPSDEIQRRVLNQQRVALLGVVANDKYLERLPAYDAFVYPSVYDNEGHPGAIIEAMLAGLPVVCTALPTVMEIVGDGTEGLAVAPQDAEGLARSMARLMSEADLYDRLAKGASEKGKMFDEDVVIPTLLQEMGMGGRLT